MKKNIIKIFVLLFAFIVSGQITLSQNLFPGMKPAEKDPVYDHLKAKMNEAKLLGDKGRIEEIQHELDKITGSSTKPAESYGGGFNLVNLPVPAMDNINAVELSQMNGIRALATVTEQRGQNVGRIWVIAAISNSTARDTIYYFTTDDGGRSWVLFGYIYLGNQDEVNFDQMDIEIIEDFSGDKYIWTVYGLTASTGKRFVGYNVIKTPAFTVGMYAFAWPGENFSNLTQARFRPRITSDNARFNLGASVYIVVSCDTLSQASHAGYVRYAYCTNPYTTAPAITYIGVHVQLLLSTSNPTDIQPDVAYINFNNNGYLILPYSNIYNSNETIYIQTLNTDFTGLTASDFTGGNNYSKEFAYIAASGGINQPTAMIVYRENYQNSGDWDLKGIKTTNAGINWTQFNIDVRRDLNIIPSAADICAVRSRENRFNIAYTVAGLSNYDTVKYVFSDAVNPGLFFRTANHLSSFARPKPGFRLVDNDSCFVVWSQKTTSGAGNNIWASSGCNGQITIGIENIGNEVPTIYKLEQNYPNPFNPLTNIKFSIPKPGFVKLVIYNLLGEEVETLVNENLSQGNYKVDFNASALASGAYLYRLVSGNFSEIKKMVLVK